MVHNKRSKNSRLRGSHTHGWGAKKKHRGAGHRGGRGAAGQGKKGDARKPSIWKDTKHLGKQGFIPRLRKAVKTINIAHLEIILPKLTHSGKAEHKNGVIAVNLTGLGYTKLLGAGEPTKKLHITVEQASAGAIEKIKAAGGDVILPAEHEKAEVKEAKS